MTTRKRKPKLGAGFVIGMEPFGPQSPPAGQIYPRTGPVHLPKKRRPKKK